MISNTDAREILEKEYYIENYEYLINDILLPDYRRDKHPTEYNNELFSSVTFLGESIECDVSIFEVYLNEGCQNRRVAITQAMFRILRDQTINNALVAFVNSDEKNFRISLLTSKYEFDGDKVVKILSSPRRFSYSLGWKTKTKTAYKFLISKGKVSSLEELISRFSVEVVNKQFYTEIATAFTELVGGERNGQKYERQLSIYGVDDHNKYAEFSVRLIGRIMFCWFLKEKRSKNNISLVPKQKLSRETIKSNDNYYHQTLEPLFFELLNTPQKRRRPEFNDEISAKVPYLNGGLFSPHADDKYEYDANAHAGKKGMVEIPNDWFNRLFTVLNDYNFTVDENTAYDIELSIDPEMLGRIFENLLAEINPETGENAKKNTGSFYTPRDIVDYMVDSSIGEYLKKKTGISEERINALITYGIDGEELAVFNKNEKRKIIDALYNVTVLDPACGSGAFPIGMLQKIVYILEKLDPDADLWFDKVTENVSIFFKKEFEKKFNSGSLNYIRKIGVIQNSIFGIDIQPIAVEMSRLRCFLSLIIEEKVNDEEENRGINPLPSLEFKFIIANTLLRLPDEKEYDRTADKNQLMLTEDISHIDKLKEVREEYFNAKDERRNELKSEFKDIQLDMATCANEQSGSSARYKELFSWRPFENKSTNWFEPDWMFGIKDGFDIIIGNPPYVQLQKTIDEVKGIKLGDLYQDLKMETFAKTGDIYCLFYERGCKLLKKGGILSFITSNKWMRADYGKKLRSFLGRRTNPLILIDFAGQNICESATVDTNILIFEKSDNNKQTKSCIATSECRNNMSEYIQQNQTVMAFDSDESWVILLPIELSIKRKIESIGVPLREWNVSINYGIKTGFNEAFIITGSKKDELISADPKSAEIIRPILRGRDIKRYTYDFSDSWLIYVPWHFPLENDETITGASADAELSFKEQYPAVYNHLLSYKNDLSKRNKAETGIRYEWYALQRWGAKYKDDFSKQKIVWGNLCLSAQYTMAEEGFFVNAPSPFIAGGSKYMLAVMNSKISDWYIRHLGVTRNGGYFEYKPMFVEKLPIPIVDENVKTKFEDIVDVIIDKKKKGDNTSALEQKIDKMLYDLYGFTLEETEHIENYDC